MRVLVVGSAGRIGKVLVEGLKEKYQLRGLDLKPTPGLEDGVVGDVADLDTVLKATEGMEAVIHLATAGGGEQPWASILRVNIIGTYNVFEASRQNGVRRIAFASRAGVQSGYPPEVFRSADLPPRPDSYYSVSKVFGESIGHMYVMRFGMEVVCVRIGNCPAGGKYPKGTGLSPGGQFLSYRDAVHLFERCIIHPGVKYEIVYGVSNNSPCRYDKEYAAKAIGYHPVDRMQDFIETD
jgi:uronate dehydrogenase